MTDLADVNVLLALHVPGHQFHRLAVDWFESCLSFATTPITDAGMVRLLTRSDVMSGQPISPQGALTMLRVLKQQPHYAFWPDGEALDQTRFAYALQGPGQVTDLHLLDLAVAHGGALVTFDSNILFSLRPSDRKHLRLLAESSR